MQTVSLVNQHALVYATLVMMGLSAIVAFLSWRRFKSAAKVWALAGVMCINGASASLWIGGVQLTVTQVVERVAPNSVKGVLDGSGSMTVCMKEAGDSPEKCYDYSSSAVWTTSYSVLRDEFVTFSNTRPFDRIAAVVFGDDLVPVTTLAGSTNPTPQTISKLPGINAPEGGTYLTIAIREGIADMASAPGRRILILGTDGEDELKMRDEKEFVEAIRAAQIKVYWIDVSTGRSDQTSQTQHEGFKHFVKSVEGTIITAHNRVEVRDAFKAIAWNHFPQLDNRLIEVTSDISAIFGIAALLLAFLALAVAFAFLREQRAV